MERQHACTAARSAQRLLRFASDLDGCWRTSRVRAPIKTAMKKEQVRERERYRRKSQNAVLATVDVKKVFPIPSHPA